MRHPATADARLGHVLDSMLDRTQAPMGSGLLFYIFHVFRKACRKGPTLATRPDADGGRILSSQIVHHGLRPSVPP